MEFLNSGSLIYICGCLVLPFIGWLVLNFIGNRRSARREAANASLRKRGVAAPAVVVSARKNFSTDLFGTKETKITYEVDVQPEGHASFRASFQTWATKTHYTAVLNQLVNEIGRKIWVTYDPNDPSQMIFEHYDEEHTKIIEQQELEARRLEFNKLAAFNDEIRKSGEEAEAVIIRVGDLDLPYPLKDSRALRLYFDVMPKSGSAFQSETYALIANAALEKYSVGKRLHVKFDPRKPERVALDSEKNKSLR